MKRYENVCFFSNWCSNTSAYFHPDPFDFKMKEEVSVEKCQPQKHVKSCFFVLINLKKPKNIFCKWNIKKKRNLQVKTVLKIEKKNILIESQSFKSLNIHFIFI